MANTKIEWADKVWNPVIGCTKAGEKCKNCYAERMAKRLAAMGKKGYGQVVNELGWNGNLYYFLERLALPNDWKKPCKIFVDSMSDLFHGDMDTAFLKTVFHVMRRESRHIYLILTSRPANAVNFLDESLLSRNIWIGVSVGTQKEADQVLDSMVRLAAMNWNTFVSFEPALEVVNWKGWEFIDWMIAGGENGPHARNMPLEAGQSIYRFCKRNKIPFFFKGWGDQSYPRAPVRREIQNFPKFIKETQA